MRDSDRIAARHLHRFLVTEIRPQRRGGDQEKGTELHEFTALEACQDWDSASAAPACGHPEPAVARPTGSHCAPASTRVVPQSGAHSPAPPVLAGSPTRSKHPASSSNRTAKGCPPTVSGPPNRPSWL